MEQTWDSIPSLSTLKVHEDSIENDLHLEHGLCRSHRCLTLAQFSIISTINYHMGEGSYRAMIDD